jgi:hypothetical protein
MAAQSYNANTVGVAGNAASSASFGAGIAALANPQSVTA